MVPSVARRDRLATKEMQWLPQRWKAADTLISGRLVIPRSGFCVKPAIDGNAVLLGDPLTSNVISALTAHAPVVELWAWWRKDAGNTALLRSLPALQRLHIINGTQDQLTVISELKGLRTLTIESNTRVNIDMTFWPSIEELAFTWSANFSNLKKATKLASLRVWSWKDKDLGLLSDVPQLRTLEVVRGSVQSLRGVEACAQLENLSLSHLSRLEDFHPICALKSLRALSIESCRRLANVNDLGTLSKLQMVSLTNLGVIATLAPLSSNGNLKKLFFAGSTNIADGDTDIVNRLEIIDFAFQNRKHYNYNYNHRQTRAERRAEYSAKRFLSEAPCPASAPYPFRKGHAAR